MQKNTRIFIGALASLAIIGGISVSMNSGNEKMITTEDKLTKNESAMGGKGSMTEERGDVFQRESVMEKENSTMMEKTEVVNKTGSYKAYDADMIASISGDIVLFFRATWCPTCRAVDTDIKANLNDIPVDLTIFDVNYDNSATLKQKYGVTYQHTFVQIDNKGNQIKKWQGSPTLSAIITEVK